MTGTSTTINVLNRVYESDGLNGGNNGKMVEISKRSVASVTVGTVCPSLAALSTIIPSWVFSGRIDIDVCLFFFFFRILYLSFFIITSDSRCPSSSSLFLSVAGRSPPPPPSRAFTLTLPCIQV